MPVLIERFDGIEGHSIDIFTRTAASAAHSPKLRTWELALDHGPHILIQCECAIPDEANPWHLRTGTRARAGEHIWDDMNPLSTA